MSNINQLSATTASSLTGSDLFVIWSNSNGDSRKISVSNFLTWLQTNFTNTSYTVEAYVPVTGQTITVTDDGLNRWMKFAPAGTLATLTVTLPADENSVDGQEILITSTERITALTVNGNGATVEGAPSSLSVDGAVLFRYNATAVTWYKVADASNLTDALLVDSSGNLLIGKTTSNTSIAGFEALDSGKVRATVDGDNCISVNRLSDDGVLISFLQASVVEGDISVSGTTVSLNGAHLTRWSQLSSGDPSAILRGTVLSNLDEMCEWDGEDNEQLNKTKVSDVASDKNVAGVFQSVDADGDMYVAMTGDFVIRVASGASVARGDLLESAGDGTAQTQADDIVRSSTIAKVTSTHVVCTYPDGSYCVPCVLMAC